MADKKDLISAAALSTYLGVSDQTVRNLQKDGHIHGVATGRSGIIKYDPFTTIPEYIRYIKSLTGEEGMKGRKLTAEARLKEAQADAAELELDELRGRLHNSADVQFFTADLCAHIRGAVLSLPSRLAMKITGVESKTEIAEIVKKECYDILTEMSDYEYDPKKYREAARNRKGFDKLHDEDADKDEDEEDDE